MEIKQFTFSHFMENCYVLADNGTRQCAIVDPGMSMPFEQQQLFHYIEQQQYTPVLLLLTHAHVDHIAGLQATAARYHLPACMHQEGYHLLKEAPMYAQAMGFETVTAMDDLATRFLQDGEILTLGVMEQSKSIEADKSTPSAEGIAIEARYVPGHCPGSMCFVVHSEEIILTGDALFRGSIGRTDLPGGDYNLLITKLRERILTLPDNYAVLPGHGDISTIGEEHLHNPFLSPDA